MAHSGDDKHDIVPDDKARDLEKDLEAGNPDTTDRTDGESSAEKPTSDEPRKKKKKKELSAAEEDEAGKEYPPMKKVIPVAICLVFTMLLFSLDRTIVATATPKITDDFNSVDDIGWYASAYMMTGCATQLVFGKIYTFYPSKWVFLFSVSVFELGSLVCGVAPSSAVFIVGRAVAGMGTGGIFSGSIVLLLNLVPLRKRPIFMALMGTVMLVSSIAGPLIGGAFTTGATWRWCFYVNLPIGGVCLMLLLWLLPAEQALSDQEKENRKMTTWQRIMKLDPIGATLFPPAIVCLLLALQWGGSAYAWGNWRIILCFVFFGVLILAFSAVQVWKGDNATLPPRILGYRSILSTTFWALCSGGSMMVAVYFIPVWFQAIQGVSAMESGIRVLPLSAASITAGLLAAPLVSRLGYYTPFLILGSVLSAVGAGLLMMWEVNTPKPVWIGYQIVYGFGVGMGQQQAGLAAQTVLPTKDVPIGVAFKFFGQNLGGAIMVSVAQNVFNQRLIDGLTDAALPGVDPETVLALGATEFQNYVDPENMDQVLVVYNDALVGVFEVAMILGALGLLFALLTEWKSIKGKGKGKGKDGEEGEVTEKEEGKETAEKGDGAKV
ncbi:uncharacterized protein MKZ38_005564 [Zalerion maritima]|uniref:Major facilitator superfamily (MFS) profile domain-containing protein n=1 Tax=Zalerion maritima TaxID=339359 RepID=A0AAD5WQ79_9PEZI|nr:uncharacterized protein MKZ38_005564 [Zalerion maritima]